MDIMKSKWKEIEANIMTGLSYMIPIVVGAGMLMSIGVLIGRFMGFEAWSSEALNSSDFITKNAAWLTQVAGVGMMGLMFPIFSAFVSYSIADRLGLASGFIGGWLAKELGAGFIGALFIGFIAGYLVKYLNQKIKISRKYIGVKTIFLIPVISSVFIVLISKFIIGPLGLQIINFISYLINLIGNVGGGVLAAFLGGAMAFDLGGPVNKTALTIGMQLTTDLNYTHTPIMQGIIISPIGIGLATILDKYVVGKEVFPQNLKANGIPALLLGLVGISEGAIPFALSDPFFIIPLNVIGTAVGVSVSYFLGSHAYLGIPSAIWGWPLVDKPVAYTLGIVIGASIICFGAIFRQNYLMKKELSIEGEEA